MKIVPETSRDTFVHCFLSFTQHVALTYMFHVRQKYLFVKELNVLNLISLAWYDLLPVLENQQPV